MSLGCDNYGEAEVSWKGLGGKQSVVLDIGRKKIKTVFPQRRGLLYSNQYNEIRKKEQHGSTPSAKSN